MDPAALQPLLDALDGQIALMRGLVDVAQREQRHLIAYEARELAAATADKQEFAHRLEASQADLKAALAQAGAAADRPAGSEPTVRELVEALDGPDAERLATRRDCLRSLGQSLRELQAMSMVHAERGLRLVHAYAELLRTGDPGGGMAEAETYTAQGRTRHDTRPIQTVSRSV